jgi:site-specific recombinase XerC
MDELLPQTRKLLLLLHEWVNGECSRLNIPQADFRFTRRQVREALGWGDTQLKVHLGRLTELEYLVAHRGRHLPFSPASELELPKVPRRLPKAILSSQEAETVLAVPDVNTAVGLRDRAILETLYSTGIRRTELTRLFIQDVDRDRGTLMIREGKGKKDRMIPIGERALAWIAAYRDRARPELLGDKPDDGALFLNSLGKDEEVFEYIDIANQELHPHLIDYFIRRKFGEDCARIQDFDRMIVF